jgi:hypothetical protein
MKELLITASLLGIVYGADARNLQSEPIKKSWLQPARIGPVEISTTLALKKHAQHQYQEQAQRQLTREKVIENLSQGMTGNNKSLVSNAVAKVDPSHYGLFIATVNALLRGMDDSNKRQVIETVANVGPLNYRLFIDTVNALSQGVNSENKHCVIRAVAEVDPSKWTDEFVQIVNVLSARMDDSNKNWVIKAVAKVDPSKGTDGFVQIVNALSLGMDSYYKSWVIEAVAKVDPSKWTDGFVQIVNALSLGMNGYAKSRVIEDVARINPLNYGLFIATVNALLRGMDDYAKSLVIEAVAKVDPSKWTDGFVQIVNALSLGMDGKNKSLVIEAVAKVDPSKWTDEFVQIVNALSLGMDSKNKSKVIEAVAHMKLEWYNPFVRYATQHNFFRIVPVEAFYSSLVNANRLDTAEQFQAIVNRLRNEYTAQGARGAPQGVAFQIHNYRNTQITSASGHKQGLENAVVEEINRLVQSLPAMDYDMAKGLVLSLTLEADRKKLSWALRCVEGSEDYKRAFTSVVSYLSSLGGNALNSWTEGWVKESTKAYDQGSGNSCVAGVRERVVTALRDVPEISDSLKELFVQGDHTVTIPLKIANIGRIKWAETLKELGANSTMTDQEAFPLFQQALREYFELDPSTDPRIKSNIEMLESDFLDNEDGEGSWTSDFKQKLQVLERGSASPANKEDTAFSVHEGVMEP